MKALRLRLASLDFARLNHLLIPQTNAQRDRFRRMRVARLLRPVVGVYSALTREGRTAFFVAVVAGALGLDVARTDAHAFFCVLGALLAASLVMSRAMRLRDAHLDASAPRRVTVGEPISLTVACKNDGRTALRGLRVSRPFLPWDGAWISRQPTLAEIRPGESAGAVVQARFSQRGEHHLDPFHGGLLVPLRLATGPQIASGGCKFLVVPKVARVVRVTTPRGKRHQPGGVALASKTGESRDLLGVRPYRPGDPVRDLHARTWARIGEPVVREYQEEYFSRIGIVLDTDRSQGDPRQLEAAISLAAGVVAHLSRGEALIDLLVVGDDVHSLTLGRSLGFFEQALDLLACVEAGPPPRADAMSKRLAPFLPRLSCVVFIALDWDDERRAIAERVRGAGVGCSVIVVAKDGSAATSTAGTTRVGALAITRGEALAL